MPVSKHRRKGKVRPRGTPPKEIPPKWWAETEPEEDVDVIPEAELAPQLLAHGSTGEAACVAGRRIP